MLKKNLYLQFQIQIPWGLVSHVHLLFHRVHSLSNCNKRRKDLLRIQKKKKSHTTKNRSQMKTKSHMTKNQDQNHNQKKNHVYLKQHLHF